MSDEALIAQAPRGGSLTDRAACVFPIVAGWMFSEPMAELLRAFGEQIPAAGASWRESTDDIATWLHLNEDLPDALDPIFDDDLKALPGLSPTQTDILRRTLAVERMSADDFNFRGTGGPHYRERSQAVVADFDDDLRDAILKLTDLLGLVSPRETRRRSYDHTLVLGGGYVSPLLRARYAATIRETGVDLGEISFLGSPRFLLTDPPEQPSAETYAPGARDEFDLMVGAAHAAFGVNPGPVQLLCGCTSTDQRCPAWPFRSDPEADKTPPEYTHERRVDLAAPGSHGIGFAVSARTSRPPYRPDTADTFGLWSRMAQPNEATNVLVVTTQVFVPFQTFDGLRRLYLPYGLDIDTVGFGAEWGDRPQTAEYLLQETLSAIRSARRLLLDAAVLLGLH